MTIKEKLEQTKDKSIKLLAEYLLEQSKTDQQLAEGILKENKTIDKAWKYCNFKAQKYLKNKSGGISGKIVTGWATHYFTEDDISINEEMGQSVRKKTAPAKQANKPKVEPKKVTNKTGVTFTPLQMDLFGEL